MNAPTKRASSRCGAAISGADERRGGVRRTPKMINNIDKRMMMLEGYKKGALPGSQVGKTVRQRMERNSIGRICARTGNCCCDGKFGRADNVDREST